MCRLLYWGMPLTGVIAEVILELAARKCIHSLLGGNKMLEITSRTGFTGFCLPDVIRLQTKAMIWVANQSFFGEYCLVLLVLDFFSMERSRGWLSRFCMWSSADGVSLFYA